MSQSVSMTLRAASVLLWIGSLSASNGAFAQDQKALAAELAAVGATSTSRCDKWLTFRDAEAGLAAASTASASQSDKDTLMLGFVIHTAMREWALGYISGVANTIKAQTHRNPLGDATENSIVAKLDAECRAKTDELFILAAQNVFNGMLPPH